MKRSISEGVQRYEDLCIQSSLCGGSKLMGLIRLDGVHWGKVGITTDFVISWNIEAFKRIQHTNFSSAICYRKGFASVSGHLGG